MLDSLQVRAWELVRAPPLMPDRPRLDVLITFTDGTTVRWHPSVKFICSTDELPTYEIMKRMNRKAKLLKEVGEHEQ